MHSLSLPIEVDLTQVYLSDEPFFQLCIHNPNLIIERSRQGGLIFMPLMGGNYFHRPSPPIL